MAMISLKKDIPNVIGMSFFVVRPPMPMILPYQLTENVIGSARRRKSMRGKLNS